MASQLQARASVSGGARLRIAIALVALKHKPAGTGFTEYILDLCTAFPTSYAPSIASEAWIRRAFELEKSVKELRGAVEEERIKSASLATESDMRITLSSTPASTPATEAPPTGKKNQKKRKAHAQAPPSSQAQSDQTSAASARVDLAGMYASLAERPLVSATRQGVLPALRLLSSVTDNTDQNLLASQETLTLIAAATDRALSGLSGVLGEILTAKTLLVARHQETLRMICKLLEHVLSSGVSVLVKKLSRKPARSYSANGKETAARAHATLETALDDILGLVLTGILVPAIRTFAILSRVHIKSFCSAHKRPKKELATIVDIRPDVFCLVDSVLSNLDSLAAHPKPSEKLINCLLNLKEGAALQVVRELDRLYPGADSQAQSINTAGSAQGPSRQERIEALARKDALWYLCNVLSLLADADSKIGSPLEGALAPVNTEAEMELESEKASLLRAAIAAALEMLLKRTNGGSGLQHTSGGRGGMGEMEYGMVLSVLESAWFGGVACKR